MIELRRQIAFPRTGPSAALEMVCRDGYVSEIQFCEKPVRLCHDTYEELEHSLSGSEIEAANWGAYQQAFAALTRYFAGQGDADLFKVPLFARRGTDFQHRVWHEMCCIPLGEVRTYGEIAKALGSAPRAVGQACGQNPVPLLIPCHRIVARNGLGGFAHSRNGLWLEIKAWLLQLERETRHAMMKVS